MAINLSGFAGAGAQFFDDNGDPLGGGLLYVYAAGTTTPVNTFTTQAGNVANTNPIVLDAGGRTPNQIWVNGGSLYKFTLRTSTGVLIGTYDNIPALDDPTVFNNLITVVGTNTLVGTSIPPITGYAAGQTYSFLVVNSNTGPVTIDIDGQGAKDITKVGNTVLASGDMPAGAMAEIEYDGTRFQLLNLVAQSSVNATNAVNVTGTIASAVTATTQSANNNSTKVATTAYADAAATAAASAPVVQQIPFVRQTVLSGPVDTNGFPNFGGSTGSTTVTASGTLIPTASNGASNRTGSIVNPSWTGLSTNGTMYLYLDIAADGTCTTGSTTLAPTYRWGGADVVTNGQNTFNIQEMQMKVGNGSTASQVWRVFVGQVTVSGNVVTAITWYALMGRYRNEQATIALSTQYSFNHNIGVSDLSTRPYLYCKTAELGFSIGDRSYAPFSDGNFGSGSSFFGLGVGTSSLAVFITISGGAPVVVNKTTGVAATITIANWGAGVLVERGW